MVIYQPSPDEALEFPNIDVCPPPERVTDNVGVISMNMACNALCESQNSGDTDPTNPTDAEEYPEQYDDEEYEEEYDEADEEYEEEYEEEEEAEEDTGEPAQEEETAQTVAPPPAAKTKRPTKKPTTPKPSNTSANKANKNVAVDVDESGNKNISIVVHNITIQSLTLKL